MEQFKIRIIELLKEDARRSSALIATMLGASEAEVSVAIRELEEANVIVKYATVVNWSKVDDDKVTALIEVQITRNVAAALMRLRNVFIYIQK